MIESKMPDEPSLAQGSTHLQVRQITRNLLFAHSLSMLVVLLIVGLSSTYLGCFFRGPVQPSDAELEAMVTNRGQRSLISYIELRDRPLLKTDWQEVSTSDGRPYSTKPYFLMPIGDWYLLVLAESATDGKRLVGPLNSLRAMDQQVIDATVRSSPQYQGRVLPAMLNSVALFEVWGYVLLTILVPWSSFSLYKLAKAVYSLVNPDETISKADVEKARLRGG